jgi:hypothetical protein
MPTNPTDDDDLIPEPDAEPSASERAHAKAFGGLVEQALAGRPLPPAMSADDRALLEVATVIRATNGAIELAAARKSSLVEAALRQAVAPAGAPPIGNVLASGIDQVKVQAATPITAARKKRFAPYVITGGSALVAAAALVALWFGTATKPVVPTAWRSRPADPLVGKIEAAQSGDAAVRIESIFADRLDGYRSRRLSGGKP